MKLRRHSAVGAANGPPPVHKIIVHLRLLLTAGLLLSLLATSRVHRSLELASSSSSRCTSSHGVTSISASLKSAITSNDASTRPCQAEYDRISATRTPGLTAQDLLRSRAHTGNLHRLQNTIAALAGRQRPIVAVVAGGSISLGHGTYSHYRYGERLQHWMNSMYPLTAQSHQVINVAAHGADMCSMAKRLNILYDDLDSKIAALNGTEEPDLILLEFAVNDYQGQDHVITIDHKTSVFFDGFQDLVLCAEVVVYSLLTKYPRAAVMFVEAQTAIVTRKSGALLHMGVAMHYGIPVVSYAEVMFTQYHRLIHMLEGMDDTSYSFPDDMWMEDGGIGLDVNRVVNASQYASAVLPYPHGCSPCQEQNIIEQFRQGGCKSICTFVDRSNIVHDRKLKCNAKQKDIPPSRSECFVPFLAHDAIHPSAVGHAILSDLIIDALATAQLRSCQDGIQYQEQDALLLPPTTFVADTFDELKLRGDFLWVHDVDRIFSRWDELTPVVGKISSGFQRYADDSLKQRPGWIATNIHGGESITFPIDLPSGQCYTVYVAILRSYKGMGTMQIEVRDYGSKKNDEASSKVTARKEVDGLWPSPISVWSDVQITDDTIQGCTGYCEVTIKSNPQIEGRDGNKIKILTVSARRCSKIK